MIFSALQGLALQSFVPAQGLALQGSALQTSLPLSCKPCNPQYELIWHILILTFSKNESAKGGLKVCHCDPPVGGEAISVLDCFVEDSSQ